MIPPRRPAGVVGLAAFLGVALTYTGIGRLGFFWDDYFILRPRPWSELLRVWHGSWDATGVVPVFYRPLAVWTDTAAFAALGFNETALHLLALLELSIGAWLIGEFVRRETRSTVLGSLAAALLAVHPSISSSAGPWWFEQNHRLSLICVGGALLAWHARRHEPRWLAWWPVHLLILAGSLFKEDVLMLAPLLLAFQWWRARTAGDIARPSRPFVVHVTLGWVIWFAMRWWLLGAVAGRPMGGPTGEWTDRLLHAGRGLWMTFFRVRAMQGEVLPIHQLTTVLLLLTTLSGLWLWRSSTSPRARLLMGYGVMTGVAFNALVALASFPTRYHLIAVGAVFFLTGVAAAWRDRTSPGPTSAAQTWPLGVASAALIACLLLSSRASVQVYRPCTSANLQLDDQLRAWLSGVPAWRDSWILPWLDEKARRCETGRDVPVTEAIPDVLRDVREGRRR